MGIARIELHNIDCMEYMRTCEENAFELAIVDPPYTNNADGLKAGYNRSQFNYQALTTPPNEIFIKQLFRVSKNQILWGFNYYLDLLPNTDSIICWWKHQNGHFSECEYAWSSQKKSRIFDRPYQKDLFNKIHPTQKPVKLYEWLLDNYAKEGDIILDTHLGSGSIAIACYNRGFNLDAWEIDHEYHEAALTRFNNHTNQLQLWLNQ